MRITLTSAAPNCCWSPAATPVVGPYREALVADGIPGAQFTVDDVRAEHERLVALGVRFTQDPAETGNVTTAIFDDTCGNLIQIVHRASWSADRV